MACTYHSEEDRTDHEGSRLGEEGSRGREVCSRQFHIDFGLLDHGKAGIARTLVEVDRSRRMEGIGESMAGRTHFRTDPPRRLDDQSHTDTAPKQLDKQAEGQRDTVDGSRSREDKSHRREVQNLG